MKKIYLFILLLIITTASAFSAIPTGDAEYVKGLKSKTYLHWFGYTPTIPAKQVYLAGSMNGWNARGTALAGPDSYGHWSVQLELPAGNYQYKFVVDGEQWFFDPLNPDKFDDGHEGFNSIIKIGKTIDKSIPAKKGDGLINLTGLEHYPTIPDIEKISSTEIRVQFNAAKNDVEKVSLVLVGNPPARHIPLHSSYVDSDLEYFQGTMKVSDKDLGYYFQVQDGKNTVYYGFNGMQKTLSYLLAFPLDLTTLNYRTVPEWTKHAVWYQIFPERFYNGDTANDCLGSRTPPWNSDWNILQPWEKGDFYSNVYFRFYGGDIQGILKKLPYLKQLGVNAIYLNPMFMSPSIHGYDTMDYRHINPHFGYLTDTTPPAGETLDPKTWKWTKTDRLFLQLVQECHRHGMKIILDGVFNHTGDQFWAFQDLMKQGKDSPYKDWYKVLDYGPPVKYQGWWGSNQLPEIRQDNNGLVPGIREHIMFITERWMDPNGDGNPEDGIDGWRLDVADLVAIPFWKDWCAVVRKTNPNAYINGEIWNRASDWTQPGLFDGVMNYEFTKRLYQYFINTQSPYHMHVVQFDQSLHELLSWYPHNINYAMQNLLDSHDTERVLSGIMNPNREYDQKNRLQDPESKDYYWDKPAPEAYQKLKLIVLFQFTFPGAPMIWYGDEVGMWGADDPSSRKPMLWKEWEPYENPKDRVNLDLFKYYRSVIQLRNNHPTLQTGDFQTIQADTSKNIYIYARNGSENIIIALNPNQQPQTIHLPLTSPCQVLFGKTGAKILTPVHGIISVQLKGFEGIILKKL